MAVDNVPWLIEGGAEHSAEVARSLAYVAMGGNEGVAEFADCVVSQTTVASGSVKVGSGACGIKNTYASQKSQAYIGRVNSDTTIAVTPTSGAGRSDMVVLRIDDPEYGGSTPVDVSVGPYIRVAIISNVGAGAVDVPGGTTYPAIPLARLDIPASTSTITSAMIKDIRQVIRPRKERSVILNNPSIYLQLTTLLPDYQNWPIAAGHTLKVPLWATKALVVAQAAGVGFEEPGADGSFRFKLGSDGSAVTSNYSQFNNVDVGGKTRLNLVAADEIAIPAAYRGTNQVLFLQGGLLHGTGDMRPMADGGTSIIIDVEFVESPVTA